MRDFILISLLISIIILFRNCVFSLGINRPVTDLTRIERLLSLIDDNKKDYDVKVTDPKTIIVDLFMKNIHYESVRNLRTEIECYQCEHCLEADPNKILSDCNICMVQRLQDDYYRFGCIEQSNESKCYEDTFFCCTDNLCNS